MRNAYFKVEFKNNGTYVKIYAPSDGGAVLDYRDVTEFLEKAGIKVDDPTVILDAALSGKDTEVRVGPLAAVKQNESVDVDVSLNHMECICRFYPPIGDGTLMTKEAILSSLAVNRVKAGIDEEAINNFLNDRQYCTDLLLAKGKEPVNGQSAKIEYFFKTIHNYEPKHNEDGSVDYKELNLISIVSDGDKLAELHPAVPGENGYTVYGDIIKAAGTKSLILVNTQNTRLSEDGKELYATCSGHANLHGGKVFVSNVYQVDGDVGAKTGNVKFDGTINIPGSVRSGYTVEASGDVVVEGVVEGATIIAGGNVVVKQGIHGKNAANIVSKGSLYSKFIESATIEVRAGVEADSILHSNITAGMYIKASGKKGFITGGEVWAEQKIEATTIGSEMGAQTLLVVGKAKKYSSSLSMITESLKKMAEEMSELNDVVTQISGMLKKGARVTPDKIERFKTSAERLKKLEEVEKTLKNQKDLMMTEIESSKQSKIVVTHYIYPGTSVEIDNSAFNFKEKRMNCTITRKQGDISFS